MTNKAFTLFMGVLTLMSISAVGFHAHVGNTPGIIWGCVCTVFNACATGYGLSKVLEEGK